MIKNKNNFLLQTEIVENLYVLYIEQVLDHLMEGKYIKLFQSILRDLKNDSGLIGQKEKKQNRRIRTGIKRLESNVIDKRIKTVIRFDKCW